MGKPNKYKIYKCPYGKRDFKVPLPYSVSGRFCKNNCELYKRGCKKWK